MDKLTRFIKFWTTDGWYYGAIIGGAVGPLVCIKHTFARYSVNQDAIPLTTALSIIVGGSTGTALGATFPLWSPYILFAQTCQIFYQSSQTRIIRTKPPDYVLHGEPPQGP